MTNMNTADFLNAVDHAAGMNDRWLFLACVLPVAAGVRRGDLLAGSAASGRDCRSQGTCATNITPRSPKSSKSKMKHRSSWRCALTATEALQECAFELRRFQERKGNMKKMKTAD
jgi:hypothetical protein